MKQFYAEHERKQFSNEAILLNTIFIPERRYICPRLYWKASHGREYRYYQTMGPVVLPDYLSKSSNRETKYVLPDYPLVIKQRNKQNHPQKTDEVNQG